MNNWTKTATILMAATTMSIVAIGQDKTQKAKKTDTQEEIIIRKKGDKTEKTTIVIEGDKVTVNGKPMKDYQGDDISIMKSHRPGAIAFNVRPNIAIAPSVSVNGYHNYEPAMAGNKAMLGVTTQKADGGVKITNITEDGGADKAGLKEDDVITKMGDKKIETPADLVAAISKLKPADKVDVAYLRSGKESKVTAVLGENKSRAFAFNMNNDFNFDLPERLSPSFDGSTFMWNKKPRIGMQIQDVEEGKGVKVNEVDDDSPAAKSGFKEGDVITQIDGKEIEGVDDLRKQVAELKEGDSLKVNFNRGGAAQSADIKIPKKLKTADL